MLTYKYIIQQQSGFPLDLVHYAQAIIRHYLEGKPFLFNAIEINFDSA